MPWLLDSLYIWAGLSLFTPESGGERATWKLTLRLMHIIKHEGIPVGAFKSRTSISFFLFFLVSIPGFAKLKRDRYH